MKASKWLVTGIVSVLIMSGFGLGMGLGLGFVNASTGENTFYSVESPQVNRDLIVNGSDPNPANRSITLNCQGNDYPIRGNISVVSGGVLTIDSCNIIFEQDTTHHYWFTVEGVRPSDGKPSQIIVKSSIITVDPYLIKAYLELPMMIKNGAIATFDQSKIQFPGNLWVVSGKLFFNNSVMDGLHGQSNPFSPSLLFRDSYIVMSGSRILSQPESYGIAGNIAKPSAKGPSDNTSSPIDALYDADSIYYGITPHKVMEIDKFDTSGLTDPITDAVLYVLYHTEGDLNDPYNGTNSIMYAAEGQPYASTGITPTAGDTSDILRSFNLYQAGIDSISEIADLNITFIHNGKNGTVMIDRMWIEITLKSQQEVALWGSTTMVAMDTFMDMDFRSVSDVGLHNYINISGNSKFYGFGVTFDMQESGNIAIDPAIVTTSANASGYLYRWLNVTVKDNAGASLANASISKTPDFQEPWKSFVLTLNDLCSPANKDIFGRLVIDHISRNYRPVSCSDYYKTFEGGVSTIPAFSDEIIGEHLPNAWFGGKYNLTINYKSNLCYAYANLSRYPSMGNKDNYHDMMVTCTFIGDHSDLYPDISAWPDSVPVDRPVDLVTTIHNGGNAPAVDFWVEIVDKSAGSIYRWEHLNLSAGNQTVLTATWIPVIKAGEVHIINVTVSPVQNEPQSLWWNNTMEKGILVATLPDLQPAGFSMKQGGVSVTRAITGTEVELSADVINSGGSNSGAFKVLFFINSTKGELVAERSVPDLAPGQTTTLTANKLLGSTPGTLKFFVVIDPDNMVKEISDGNNEASTTLDVFYPPDLLPSGLKYTSPALETRSYVTFTLDVINKGVWDVTDVNITLYAEKDGNKTLINSSVVQSIGAGRTRSVSMNWTLNDGDEGNYTITAWVNENDLSLPKEGKDNRSNNMISMNLTVSKMQVLITVAAFLNGGVINVDADAQFVIFGTVVRMSNQAPLSGYKVIVSILGTSIRLEALTSETGSFTVFPRAPNTPGSSYDVRIEVEGFPENALLGKISINKQAEVIPLWMLIVIIVVVAVIAVFVAFYVLGKSAREKMVECGECGALISETRTTCPKCGAVFEPNVVKCSSCLAWIPATATECPKCGVIFVGKKKKGETYEEIMRKHYDDWVEEFRKKYRAKVGARFSEPAFQQWFKQQSEYRTFEEWMAEEEAKKRGKICPQCGTNNPFDAEVCQVCGNEFIPGTKKTKEEGAPKEPEKEKEKPAPAAPKGAPPGEKKRVVKPAVPEVSEEVKKRCPTCGAMNPLTRELCIDCGEKLPPPKTCSGCNNLIPSDAKFCPLCGKPQ